MPIEHDGQRSISMHRWIGQIVWKETRHAFRKNGITSSWRQYGQSWSPNPWRFRWYIFSVWIHWSVPAGLNEPYNIPSNDFSVVPYATSCGVPVRKISSSRSQVGASRSMSRFHTWRRFPNIKLQKVWTFIPWPWESLMSHEDNNSSGRGLKRIGQSWELNPRSPFMKNYVCTLLVADVAYSRVGLGVLSAST